MLIGVKTSETFYSFLKRFRIIQLYPFHTYRIDLKNPNSIISKKLCTQADFSKTVDFCKKNIFFRFFFSQKHTEGSSRKKWEKNEKRKNRIGLDTIWWKTHLKYGKFYNNKVKFTLTDPMSDVFIFSRKSLKKEGVASNIALKKNLEIARFLIKMLQKTHVLANRMNFSLLTTNLIFVKHREISKPALKWASNETK